MHAFVAEHRQIFSVRTMCRCLGIQVSGSYAWLKAPLSLRAKEDVRQTALIRKAWQDSGKVYSYRKLHDDLWISVRLAVRTGLRIWPDWPGSRPRSAKSADRAGMAARHRSLSIMHWTVGSTWMRRTGHGTKRGSPSVQEQWSSDITCIRTLEGFVYFPVVIDLYCRRVIG